tara:strand:+ start:1261 stop:1812 length:552 start_codon:yes stop_codon:yes gene_type:complete
MRLPLTALLTCLLPLSAAAVVKDSRPEGFTLENSARVPAQADETWDALVNHVGKWWPADHTWWGESGNLTIEARAGGCFCERAGGRQARHLEVVFVDPGKTLRLAGGLGPLQGMGLDGTLEFRLAPAEEGGTLVTLWYRAGGYTPDDLSAFAPVVDRVQAQQLDGLVRFLTERHAGAGAKQAD